VVAMVLLDHFRPPLSSRRHWHAFHNAWATYLATDLNQKLPAGFFAEPNVQFGIEIPRNLCTNLQIAKNYRKLEHNSQPKDLLTKL
jgi:hypothetical protein